MYTYAYYRRYVQTYIHTYIHTYTVHTVPVGNVLSTITLLRQMSNVTDDPVTCHTVHTVHVIPRHNISIHTYIHTYIHRLVVACTTNKIYLHYKIQCTSNKQEASRTYILTYLHCHT